MALKNDDLVWVKQQLAPKRVPAGCDVFQLSLLGQL
jgi:hypothetical protein